MGLILAGGVLGVLYGYTDSLSAVQSARTELFINIFAAAIILLYSVPQKESAIIVVLCVFLALPWLRNKVHKITLVGGEEEISEKMKEYIKEGVDNTQQNMDALVFQYKENPELLERLHPDTKRKVCAMIKSYDRLNFCEGN